MDGASHADDGGATEYEFARPYATLSRGVERLDLSRQRER